MDNLMLKEFEAVYGAGSHGDYWDMSEKSYGLRGRLVEQYSWAIPTTEALTMIAVNAPIVEIGAGTGYWAALLISMGVDIVAYDLNPPGGARENSYRHKRTYTTVNEGNHKKLLRHADRALFLCWPPYAEPMAHECLSAFKGDTLIYIGEGWGGCNADQDFWDLLRKEWEDVATCDIPQFSGLHDGLSVYKRSAEGMERLMKRQARNVAKRERRARKAA
jgi:hypothetical protein